MENDFHRKKIPTQFQIGISNKMDSVKDWTTENFRMLKDYTNYIFLSKNLWDILFTQPNEYSSFIEIQCTCTQQNAWPDLRLLFPSYSTTNIFVSFQPKRSLNSIHSVSFGIHLLNFFFFFWSNVNANDRNFEIRQNVFFFLVETYECGWKFKCITFSCIHSIHWKG